MITFLANIIIKGTANNKELSVTCVICVALANIHKHANTGTKSDKIQDLHQSTQRRYIHLKHPNIYLKYMYIHKLIHSYKQLESYAQIQTMIYTQVYTQQKYIHVYDNHYQNVAM
jgi:hypothetical protein